MKKVWIAILSFALVLSVLTGCQTTNDGNGAVKIGIAAPEATHGWVAGVAYYAKKYCKDNKLDYQITISNDVKSMSEKLDELAMWGADVIIAYPQWEGMEGAIQKAADKGIKVVNFDIDINCRGIHKVTGDNYGMGYACAKYISEKCGPKATVAIMDVPSSGSVAELRLQGFYNYLETIGYDTSDFFVVNTEFDREAGKKDMAEVLKNHEHIDAVFSLDDETSLGVVQAIREAGRSDIKAITGGGGMQEYFKMIADPSYADLGLVTALYSPQMVNDAIALGIDLIKGKTVQDQVIIIPTQMVTSENAASFIDEENTVY